MSESNSQTIRNGVIVIIVASAILSLWEAFREIVFGLAGRLWALGPPMLAALLDTYRIPGWLLLVLLLIATTAFVTFLRKPSRFNDADQESLYVEDDLFGAKWRWTWTRGEPSGLCCFCPSCDGELVYREHHQSRRSFTALPDHTTFSCEHCDITLVKLRGLKRFALGTVKREVERRMRVGEWKPDGQADAAQR